MTTTLTADQWLEQAREDLVDASIDLANAMSSFKRYQAVPPAAEFKNAVLPIRIEELRRGVEKTISAIDTVIRVCDKTRAEARAS
jgi:hypothetical protein